MSTEHAISLLFDKWCVYYHLPQDKTWDISSYVCIARNLDSVESAIAVMRAVQDSTIVHCMLFVMRSGIAPQWEHAKNRTGGAFSFKVANKFAPAVWRELYYALCGETLTLDYAHSRMVNGITISPKKNFVIIKVWMSSCELQDPAILIPIMNLSKQGALFKSHAPEF